jgi:hypothetical protein
MPASAFSIGNVTCFSTSKGESSARRVDLHLVVGDVRDGVDRELLELEEADGRDHRREDDDEPAVLDREVKQGFKHGMVSLSGVGSQCSCAAEPLPSSALRMNVPAMTNRSPSTTRHRREPSRRRLADRDRPLGEGVGLAFDGHEDRRAALDGLDRLIGHGDHRRGVRPPGPSATISACANMPGEHEPVLERGGTSMRTWAVRVVGSTSGAMNATVPSKRLLPSLPVAEPT